MPLLTSSDQNDDDDQDDGWDDSYDDDDLGLGHCYANDDDDDGQDDSYDDDDPFSKYTTPCFYVCDMRIFAGI